MGLTAAMLTKALSIKFPTVRFVLTISNVHPLGTVKCEKITPKTFES